MVNKILVVLAYAVLGFYFINYPFNFVEIPEIVTDYNSWIVFVGGILIFLAAFNFLKTSHAPK